MWVAEHGWCYLNAIIDCCTREIAGWSLDVRCRAQEAIDVVEQATAERGIEPGTLTLSTDNGTAYTSRSFRARLHEHGITHRRGGYRDPWRATGPRAGGRIGSSTASTMRHGWS